MSRTVKIEIKDEVNVRIHDLDVGDRRALQKMFEYEKPGARYLPSVRLGRWNGKISYFSLAGSTYLNLLEDIITYLYDKNYDIEIDDQRQQHGKLEFDLIREDSFADIVWPVGHEREGQPIVLRDYQVEIVNNFLANPQCLQEVATGAGKCLSGDTIIEISINDENAFGQFVIDKLRREQVNNVTRDNK